MPAHGPGGRARVTRRDEISTSDLEFGLQRGIILDAPMDLRGENPPTEGRSRINSLKIQQGTGTGSCGSHRELRRKLGTRPWRLTQHFAQPPTAERSGTSLSRFIGPYPSQGVRKMTLCLRHLTSLNPQPWPNAETRAGRGAAYHTPDRTPENCGCPERGQSEEQSQPRAAERGTRDEKT